MKPVIINLTSFPPRFKTLHLTLKTLLLQRVKPDEVVLWLYAEDIEQLPQSVLVLKKDGLTIKAVEKDIRSYKKLIPALNEFPDAFHVTVDDDVYYPRDLLLGFEREYQPEAKEILCYRANRMTFDADGRVKPYIEWDFNIGGGSASDKILFTGVGGVLYSPQCMDERVLTEDYMSLAPYSDDLWFYWMIRINGYQVRKIGQAKKYVTWKGTQAQSLWRTANNLQSENQNDLTIERLNRRFPLL
ncbi:hypothetical protein [Thiomicrorhabdus sp. 6S3-12]|uniref:hypothetical protein n=1 Tax=Thiomicrorhabdus sp. 6S3-12 TaxID=2819681 RepID=UPI001AAD8BE1|nr:hypothetical protein [Thiomicrorhabdus sp. 6S3-12]MBO1923739.1 hypothetical protein [Thiomicrorhabdus sp. 6S3-12]